MEALHPPLANKAWIGRVVLCALLIVIGSLPAPGLSSTFNRLFCETANVLFHSVTFGDGGHAELIPLEKAPTVSELSVRMSVDGDPGHWDVERSTRKFAYLPLLLVLALIAVTPLPLGRKVACAVFGVAASLSVSIAALWLTAVYSFSQGMSGVYHFGALRMNALDLAMRTFVMPTSLWKMGPVLLGLFVIWGEHIVFDWWQEHRAARGGAALGAAAPVPASSGWKPANKRLRRKRR